MSRDWLKLDYGALCVALAGFLIAAIGSIVLEFISPTARSCKEKMCMSIDSIPFEDELTPGLYKAMLCAEKKDVSSKTKQTFRASGASHILALSGMHLGIIYGIISLVLRIIGNSPTAKKTRSIIALCIAAFYTIVTGAGPSVFRALLFILIREGARLAGRECSLTRCLIYALTIQLMISPRSISEPGFQLSYLATLGICVLYPRMEKLYEGNGRKGLLDPMKRVWELTCVSISCQAFTALAVWYHFHSFPKHFLISNLLALPVTQAAMTIGIIDVGLQSTFGCPQFMAKAGSTLCQTLVHILEIVEKM